MTPHKWATEIAHRLQTHYTQHGHPTYPTLIGNPNVGGDAQCGPEIHVDMGPLWRAVEPWPTQWGEQVRRRTIGLATDPTNDVAELNVAVSVCVPTLDETGAPPGELARRESVDLVASLGFGLHEGMWAIRDVLRHVDGWGLMYVDRVSPIAKDGGMMRWECRVLVPFCLDC
jgi:hypothetical protein